MIDFVLANSPDPDEMLHYAAFHLDRHWFAKYRFWGVQSQRVNCIVNLKIDDTKDNKSQKLLSEQFSHVSGADM